MAYFCQVISNDLHLTHFKILKKTRTRASGYQVELTRFDGEAILSTRPGTIEKMFSHILVYEKHGNTSKYNFIIVIILEYS